MTNFDVTVIIPNFNRTASLKRALASLTAQSHRPNEVIVVDDCSTTDKLQEIRAIIAEFANELDVELLINEENKGANYSRNRGLRAASSSYVAFLDSDDFWMPRKLEAQMDCIKSAKILDNRPVLSSTGRYRVNDDGEIIARQFGGAVFSASRIAKSNFIGTLSSVVVDASAAREANGFNEELHASQDWDFFIRLSKNVQYVGIEYPLCIYVDHNELRITSNSKRRIMAHLEMRKMHLKLNGYPEISMDALARIMAEDFQNSGNKNISTVLYAKHIYSKRSFLFRRLIPEWTFICFFKKRGVPDLKSERYARYAQALKTFVQDPAQHEIVEIDQRTIRLMMR